MRIYFKGVGELYINVIYLENKFLFFLYLLSVRNSLAFKIYKLSCNINFLMEGEM